MCVCCVCVWCVCLASVVCVWCVCGVCVCVCDTVVIGRADLAKSALDSLPLRFSNQLYLQEPVSYSSPLPSVIIFILLQKVLDLYCIP